MAINLNVQYPGRTGAPSEDYPFGSAQNITTAGDGTGTPLEQTWLNDLFGFQQGLLEAAGLVPSGNPDTARESQYLTALTTLYRESVKLSSFGVVDDPAGDTDQYALVQEAADFCRDNNRVLNIDVSFYSDADSNGTLYFYTDTVFTKGAALVYVDQTVTVLTFTNVNAGVVVTPASVTGLSRYSVSLSGLPSHNANDLLVVNSNEELIERLNDATGLYRKRETLILADNNGTLADMVMEDYDTAQINTLTLYQREPTLLVKDLKFTTGTGTPVNCNVDGLVVAEHRYIEHERTNFDLIRNDYTNWKNYECVAWNKNPVMNSDYDNSIGYGIYNFVTAMSVTTDGVILRCRHAVAGRHDKNTTVRGGIYERDIDTHYGYNLKAIDLTMKGSFSFAGENFYSSGCKVYIDEENGVWQERSDTPETRGTVTVKDIDIYANIPVTNGDIFVAVFGAQSDFTFNRDLQKPDVVNIKDVRIHDLSGYFPCKILAHLRPDGYNYTSFGELNIDTVTRINNDDAMEAISSFTKGDTQVWTRDTIINLRNLPEVTTRQKNTETVFDDTYGYIINAFNVTDLSIRTDKSCIKGGKILSSTITRLSNDSTSDFSITDSLGTLYIDRSCELEYTIDQALVPILRGRFKTVMDTDTVHVFPMRFKAVGRIDVMCVDDPYGSGAASLDENQNYAFRIWGDDTFTGAFRAIDDTVLTGTTGGVDDITVSVTNFNLYLEMRRGDATSRPLIVELNTNV